MRRLFLLLLAITLIASGCTANQKPIEGNNEVKEEVAKTEKEEVQKSDELDKEDNEKEAKEEIKEEVKNDNQETKEEDKATADNQDIKESDEAKNIFVNPTPQVLKDVVNINPAKVYYDGDKLIMEAWVSNGFNTTVYNIHNIEIKLSDKNEEVIAHATFDSMPNAKIAPNQSIIWTFIFAGDAVKNHNADLSYLITNSSTYYNY